MQGGLGSGPAHTAHTEEDLHSPRQRENPTAGGQAEGELGKERAFFLAEQRALHLHFAPGLQGLAKEDTRLGAQEGLGIGADKLKRQWCPQRMAIREGFPLCPGGSHRGSSGKPAESPGTGAAGTGLQIQARVGAQSPDPPRALGQSHTGDQEGCRAIREQEKSLER